MSLIKFAEDGGSVQTNSSTRVVKEKLTFLLLANKGEIPNDLNYGTDLVQFCFRPLDAALRGIIESVIRAEVAINMPYVTIKELAFREDLAGILAFSVFYELAEGFEDFVSIEIGV
jgi:phage baseplate assembly protein W